MKEDFEFEIDFCRSILRRDPENLPSMELLAGYCTRAGRIEEGLEMDRQIVQLDPDNPVGHYNLACSLALKQRLEEALGALRTAMEKGYRDFDWMVEDPDLKSLHDHPGFSSLVAEFRVKQ